MLKFAAALFASLAIAAPSVAAPVTGTMQDHQELWAALNESGVTTYINHEQCEVMEAAGFYVSAYNVLVVCQDNRVNSDVEVAWTANDLDTLRHEAHHVVQDCKVGAQGDNQLGSVFDNDEDWKTFILNSGYSREELNAIAEAYASRGADENTLVIELEAFAVANSVNASTIADAVRHYCGQ